MPFLDCVVSLSKDGYLSIESMGSPSPTGAQTQGDLDTTRLASEGSLKHRGKTKGTDTHEDSGPHMWQPKVDLCQIVKRRHKEPPEGESEKRKNV